MIAAHDTYSRLGSIVPPTLILCGDKNLCTPLPLSEELAAVIPHATLIVLEDAAELIEIEKEQEFFDLVAAFVEQWSTA